ncbi:ABC transporter ATP-binding protein [Actinophytocola oryzae]|uniref:ABC-2 type transport system ATP-binding protein n=1 Tax=Actinophytocola oryzae TaxID=502181 RepID=A0A4R7W0P8_9PSEU|nr:ATP-binding cassette domain-containing protein [Actinophytocola oryzae]TDV55962.1 ABC-2 type transport system ATP-binding protein [Actinophytocola oryzae]
MEPLIATTGLGKTFGAVQALADVTLAVGAGRILGLLGHNGAGKTTLIDILSTRIPADTGTALVCGWDVREHGARVRRRIAVASQFTTLDDDLSGRDNLVLFARLLGATVRQARRRAGELLDVFGLADAADLPVRGYSGGMRRRTDLAVCLLGRPDVLFLDEPSTGLDPVACRQLWDMVKGLANTGITVVLTTQYLAEAEHLADEVAVLALGRVVAAGTPAELKRRIGTQTLTLTFADAWQGDRAAGWLRQAGHPGVADPLRATVVVPVAGGADVVSIIRLVGTAGFDVADVRVTEPTLEDVYLSLHTGQSPAVRVG